MYHPDHRVNDVDFHIDARNAYKDAVAWGFTDVFRKLQPDRVRTVTANALVDTGAVRCVLPPHIVHRLGLKPRRTRVVEYADGRKEEVGVVSGVIAFSASAPLNTTV